MTLTEREKELILKAIEQELKEWQVAEMRNDLIGYTKGKWECQSAIQELEAIIEKVKAL
jgi:hypothetical protein